MNAIPEQARAEAARAADPQPRRGRVQRLRALFDPDEVTRIVVDDMAMDINKAYQSGWEQTSTTGFWQIARRLPKLLRLTLSHAAASSKPRTVWMLVTQGVAGICQAISLWATTGALGALFAGHPTPARVAAALPSLIVIAVFTAVQAGANSVGTMLSAQLQPRMDAAAMMRLQSLCTRVELVAFDEAGWMDDEVRAERGAVSPRYLLQATVRVMRGVVAIASSALVLALVSPLLLPLLALTIAPKMWANIRSARLGYVVFVRHNEAHRRKNQISFLGQSTTYAPEIRALGLADYLGGRFRRLSEMFEKEDVSLARAQSLAGMAGDTLSGIAMAASYAVLFGLLSAGWIPLAVGGTAYFAISRANSALMSLVTFANNMYTEGLYIEAYEAFCLRAEARLPKAAITGTPDGFGDITVEDVTFTYTGATRPAVSNASLTIRAGTVVALVGENGAAKTTLAKLIGRQYEPDSGRICWDGADTAGMDPERLRAQMAYIAQDGMRAPFSAAENIRIGAWRDVDTLEPVQDAARRADAHDFISNLPDGYGTLMDRSLTHGSNVSGGQWQRLGLARGLIKDAALVLADEPTAHLDAASEIAFYQQMRTYGGTVVLVTHRMNAVRACADHIYVVEHGTITASGTHDELMTGDNWYSRAFLLQQNSFNAATPAESRTSA